jgi:hypothetical protein
LSLTGALKHSSLVSEAATYIQTDRPPTSYAMAFQYCK